MSVYILRIMPPTAKQELVAVISDTHGLLRPEVLRVFKDVTLVLHAGDIGSADVLDDLRRLAPVIAVRGNNDTGQWASRIPESTVARVGAISIYMLHDLKEMKEKPASEKFQVVVSGHSHRPCIDERGGVLFVNPGSAGPRRFKLPVSVARIIVERARVRAELIELL
jgi:putative phosphoesterase